MEKETLHLLDYSSEAIVLTTSDHRILHWNNAAQKLFGKEKVALGKTTMGEIFPEYDELQKTRANKRMQLFIRGKDDAKVPVSVKHVHWGDQQQKAYFFKNLTRRFFLRDSLLQKINVVEQLSLLKISSEGNLQEAIKTILKHASKAMGVERVNAWKISKDFTRITCIGNAGSEEMSGAVLTKEMMPAYFSLLESREIIITNDVYSDPKTGELVESYLRPNNIYSMLEIPVRINGLMRGVVCFEKTGEVKEWDLFEQKFGLLIAQMIALVVETVEKNNYRNELERSLEENKVLLKELNHRVKNNFSILYSLITLQREQAKDEFHRELFTECLNRLYTTSALQDMLMKSDSVEAVDSSEFFSTIAHHVFDSLISKERNIELKVNCVQQNISTAQATACGLIINELITNSIKHGFPNNTKGMIALTTQVKDHSLQVSCMDTGKGMDTHLKDGHSLGMGLINDLCKQLNAEVEVKNENGFHFSFYFPIG